MSQKYVYLFSEGNASMRELLGGKGANLAEMTNSDCRFPRASPSPPRPAPSTMRTAAKSTTKSMAQIMEYVGKMEELNGKKFGDLKNPLLVSVRSGARASMPGMMDTILNLGLNDEVVEAMIAEQPAIPVLALDDSYRRFIQMFSDVVMEVGKKYFEQLIDEMKAKKGVKLDVELTADDLKELAEQFKAEYKEQDRRGFPLRSQRRSLWKLCKAVFRSWDNPRANVYRRDERHSLLLGHRRQRTVHGVRQHGRQLRHRRGLHPRPRHRREEAVWANS